MKYLRFTIILIFLFCLAWQPATHAAKPFNIEMSLSKDTVFVGDTFDIIISVTYTSEVGKVSVEQPEFPELLEFEKVGNVQLYQSHNIVQNPLSNKPSAQATYEFVRTYRALKQGEFQIPRVEIIIKDPAQPLGTLTTRTNSVKITVLDVAQKPPEPEKEKEPEKKEEEGIRDIKGPVPAPTWILYLFGIGSSAILLALALAIARTIKPATKPPADKEKPRIIESPFTRAISRLKEIQPPTSGDDSDITAFYIRLVEIVKEYLAKHHGVMGFEATSYEITSEMREAWRKFKRRDDLIKSLQTFLSEVDLGRYAKGYRERESMLKAIDRAREFITLDNQLTSKPAE